MPDSSKFRSVKAGELRRVNASELRDTDAGEFRDVTAGDIEKIYESPSNLGRGDRSKRPVRE